MFINPPTFELLLEGLPTFEKSFPLLVVIVFFYDKTIEAKSHFLYFGMDKVIHPSLLAFGLG